MITKYFGDLQLLQVDILSLIIFPIAILIATMAIAFLLIRKKIFFGKSFLTTDEAALKLASFFFPATILLVILDNCIDAFELESNFGSPTYLFIKVLISIPFVGFIILFFSKYISKKLLNKDLQIEKSERKFRLIFENDSSAIVVFKPDTTITMVNEAFCQTTGFSKDDIIGSSWTQIVPPEDLELLMNNNRKRFQNQDEVKSRYEFRFCRINGEIRNGFLSSSYNLELNQFIVSFSDITELKNTSKALKESEERYRNLIENQGEGIVFVDENEQFIFANPAADRIMGVQKGGLLGKMLNEFTTGESFSLIQEMTKLRKKGLKNSYEFEILRANGEKRIVFTTVTPRMDENGLFEGSLGVFVDVTDRKNIETALKNSELSLKELNTTKDKLFSIIAHDLRGPIGTTSDLLSFLIDNSSEISNEDQHHLLNILRDSTSSTFNLLETLLSWATVQTKNIIFKPEPIDISSCISILIKNMKVQAGTKDISLNFSPAEGIYVNADLNMINTAIRNLIGNAIKFTNKGGRVDVSVVSVKGNIEISISDNGIGMDEETMNNLFTLNKQVSKYGTANEKGSGLGLILCKEFIEKQGGSIWVESELGKGSRFIFTIPESERKISGISKDESPVKFNQQRILVAEDDDINFKIIESILTMANLVVDRAYNGKDAIDLFLKNRHQLILMDIEMPEMNGWEATMSIREYDSEVPIIAITAYTSEPAKDRNLKAGCNDYLPKPINKPSLMRTIKKYL